MSSKPSGPKVQTQADPGAELLRLAERLDDFVSGASDGPVKSALDSLEAAVHQLGESWGGSWLGYQAFIYYAGLSPRPAGAQFSIEWGIEERYAIQATNGDWREFTQEEVQAEIRRRAGDPDIAEARAFSKRGGTLFDDCRAEAESIVATLLRAKKDVYLESLQTNLTNLSIPRFNDFIEAWKPGTTMSRDSLAVSQGFKIPPHLKSLADVLALRAPAELCDQLAKVVRKMGRHVARSRVSNESTTSTSPKRVFIGHGRSHIWRELKDMLQDRLALQWDEFNRVSPAGKSTVERLSEMLDEAGIAFLIMTAEDEASGGKMNARLNVIHEVGLFQGRLGFRRAIILLEEGCEEFSNIVGLSQIRFPKGNISAKFEEIRLLLEREGMIDEKR